MSVAKGRTVEEAIKSLGYTRAEAYRRLKSGKLYRKTFHDGLSRVYILYENPSEVEHLNIANFRESLGKTRGGFAMESYPSKSTHSKLLKEWLQWYTDNIDVSSWRNENQKLRYLYIQKYFDNYDVISLDNLRNWLATADKEQVSKRRHMHGAVSSFAKFLHKNKKLFGREEWQEIRDLYPEEPPGFQRHQKLIYSEDLPRILEAAERAAGNDDYKKILFKTLVILFGTTGFRLSEVCNLTLGQMRFSEDLERATITVTGKKGKVRTVPFHYITQQAILKYLDIRPIREEMREVNSDTLFWVWNPVQKGYTTLKKYTLCDYMKLISDEAGISFTSHSFRHEFATDCFNQKLQPAHIQQLLGHADLTTTQVYKHTRDIDAIRTAGQLAWEKFGLESPNQPQGYDNKSDIPEAQKVVNIFKEIANLPQEERELIAKMLGSGG